MLVLQCNNKFNCCPKRKIKWNFWRKNVLDEKLNGKENWQQIFRNGVKNRSKICKNGGKNGKNDEWNGQTNIK